MRYINQYEDGKKILTSMRTVDERYLPVWRQLKYIYQYEDVERYLQVWGQMKYIYLYEDGWKTFTKMRTDERYLPVWGRMKDIYQYEDKWKIFTSMRTVER